jgi:hypothetical protein
VTLQRELELDLDPGNEFELELGTILKLGIELLLLLLPPLLMDQQVMIPLSLGK